MGRIRLLSAGVAEFIRARVLRSPDRRLEGGNGDEASHLRHWHGFVAGLCRAFSRSREGGAVYHHYVGAAAGPGPGVYKFGWERSSTTKTKGDSISN